MAPQPPASVDDECRHQHARVRADASSRQATWTAWRYGWR